MTRQGRIGGFARVHTVPRLPEARIAVVPMNSSMNDAFAIVICELRPLADRLPEVVFRKSKSKSFQILLGGPFSAGRTDRGISAV